MRSVGGRRHETNDEDRGLAEVWFDGLNRGDIILLETESGSSYQLFVQDTLGRVKVTMERTSSHDVKGDDRTLWSQLDEDTVFELRGSCERVLASEATGLVAVDDTEGRFVVGERAWLGTEIDGIDRTVITTRLKAVNLIPAV